MLSTSLLLATEDLSWTCSLISLTHCESFMDLDFLPPLLCTADPSCSIDYICNCSSLLYSRIRHLVNPSSPGSGSSSNFHSIAKLFPCFFFMKASKMLVGGCSCIYGTSCACWCSNYFIIGPPTIIFAQLFNDIYF